ncbi:MAG: hypothetical protein ACI4QE_01305 [Acutalibacteraceae bacterium]
MDIVKGSIVKAKAGRDKDKFFVVMKVEGKYAYIADGKRRKVESPKKKNLLHLAKVNKSFNGSECTNRKIREALREWAVN